MDASRSRPRNESYLTQAAKEALDELLEEKRADVVSAATEAAAGGPVSAADVVRSYFASEGAARIKEFPNTVRAPGRNRQDSFLSLVMVMGVTLVLVSFFFQAVGSGIGLPEPVDLVILAAGASIALTASIAQILSTRRLYRKALRQARVAESMLGGGGVARALKEKSADPGMFLMEWYEIESEVYGMASEISPDLQDAPFGALLERFVEQGFIDPKVYQDVRALLRIRNDVVDGIGLAADTIVRARSLTRQTLSSLEASREALRRNRRLRD